MLPSDLTQTVGMRDPRILYVLDCARVRNAHLALVGAGAGACALWGAGAGANLGAHAGAMLDAIVGARLGAMPGAMSPATAGGESAGPESSIYPAAACDTGS